MGDAQGFSLTRGASLYFPEDSVITFQNIMVTFPHEHTMCETW